LDTNNLILQGGEQGLHGPGIFELPQRRRGCLADPEILILQDSEEGLHRARVSELPQRLCGLDSLLGISAL
jgi:hypothetical protein